MIPSELRYDTLGERLLDRLKNPKSDRLYCRWWVGTGGLNTQQIQSIIRSLGNQLFLSRTHNDTVVGFTGF